MDYSSQENETVVHGTRWHTIHDGYFADPKIARPFLDAISREISNFKPSVVADLGGGIGFILSELAKRHPEPSIKYVNVDISPEQLLECTYEGIRSLQMSAMAVTRDALIKDDGQLMFVMRSLLHYLGRDGFARFLRHLRAQMKRGETMIHQTACFASSEEADCVNDLYALMRTTKWYPTVVRVMQTLNETGWELADFKPAPSLCLKSSDLAERYGLSPADIAQIVCEVGGKYNQGSVFIAETSDFTAYLHYRIFVCRATG